MAHADRPTSVDVTHPTLPLLPTKAGNYSFFPLVELLLRLSKSNIRDFSALVPAKEPIRFSASPSIAFAPRDVISAGHTPGGKYAIEVSFLGLHGSQSPMPGYYLDPLAWEDAQQQPGLSDFLDFFNHRLVVLLLQIWRKYRYYISFENGGKDPFSERMFSLVGLGDQRIRDSLPINHSKMLAYAGLLANPGRAPDVIVGLVSHCFDLPQVRVQPWQFRRVPIGVPQQNRLGKTNCDMGSNMVIGSSIADISGKFTLCIDELSRERFLSFLPNGSQYDALVTFISFILRDQFAWDLRLGIAANQAGGLCLGEEQNSLLGWTSFLGNPPASPNVTIRVRE